MTPSPEDIARLDARDALDLAILVEEEAFERYCEFADQMEVHRNEDARRFFQFMAGNEDKHRETLAERRRERFGDEPVRVGRHILFDVEAPEYFEVAVFSTVREALETALGAEKKAHDFFVQAMTQTSDPEVRRLFAELRDEETAHQNLVLEQIARLPPEPELSTADYADPPRSVD